MTYQLDPLDLKAMSPIRVAYQGTRHRPGGQYDLLVISYSGVYREGSAGKPDARLIEALGQAAMIAWEPEGLILDFSNLVYRWGEDLQSILNIGDRAFGNESLPMALVVGPDCEQGVISLFGGPKPVSPPEWIFRDLPSAWSYIESEMADCRARLRGIMRPHLI